MQLSFSTSGPFRLFLTEGTENTPNDLPRTCHSRNATLSADRRDWRGLVDRHAAEENGGRSPTLHSPPSAHEGTLVT